VVGTPGYMSPEQVRGDAVDHRSDLFSFGSILYEILAGRPAFIRETPADTMSAILKEEPPEALPTTVPPALERIVSRCLEKTRETRFQSARDLAFGLEFLSGTHTTAAPAAVVATPRHWRAALGVGVVVLSLFTAVASWLTRDATPEPTLDNLLAHATFKALTTWAGSELDADISPDGKFFVFLADRDGPFHAFLGQVDGEGLSDLTPGMATQQNPGPTRSVGFSADGSEIWVNGTRGRELRRIAIVGGASRPFLGDHAVDVAWSRDGKHLVYFTYDADPGDPVFVADGTGGNAIKIFESKGYHNHFPVWSADGQWIYFTHGKIRPEKSEFDVWRIPSSGGKAEPVIQLNTDVRYLTRIDAETLLYVAPDENGWGLWALDLKRRVTHRVNTGLEKYLSVAASADGHRLVATVATSTASLWSVPILDRNRVAEERDVKPYPPQGVRALAPRLGGGSLFYLSDSGPGDGLWRLQDGKPVNIWKGSDGALLGPPAVSLKEGRVAVALTVKGRQRLTLVLGDGARHDSLTEGIDVVGTAAWSPDATRIATGGSDEQGPGLFIIPVDGGKPVRLVSGPAFDPVWSPTEDLIVYSGEQGANSSLLAVRLDKRSVDLPLVRVPFGGGGRARFLPNGNLVSVQGGAGAQDFWLLDLATGKSRQITRLSNPASMFAFDITPDGRQIVFDRVRQNSDIRLIDLPKR
jgi:Tol biopolymer transport system component